MREIESKRIAWEVTSPAYVFSRKDFRERVEETARILGDDIDLCYSMKANPFLVNILPERFRHVEVCSPGELEICIARNIPAEMIIYSGLNKGEKDVARALEYGVDMITAESMLHLELIEKAASAISATPRVLLRIAAGSQFGIDREEAAEILSRRSEWKGMEFKGLHFFTGTQKRKPKEVAKEMDFLMSYMQRLEKDAGYRPEIIEYGTGCPAHLFQEKNIDSFSKAIEEEIQFLRETADPLKEVAKQVKLSVEMGRFFAASCGRYITQVVDTKSNDEINYAVVDGGSHQIRFYGQMMGMQQPFMTHAPAKDPGGDSEDNDSLADTKEWTIAGSLCTTADVLARKTEFTNLKRGDRLIFDQAGAYALYEGMSLFLSRDIPGMYLLDEKGALKKVRDHMDTHSFNGAL